MPVMTVPLMLLTLTAVRSTWRMLVFVAPEQTSSIGENESAKRAPVPAVSAIMPAGARALPAWIELTLIPLEVCLNIVHPHPPETPDNAAPVVVAVTL